MARDDTSRFILGIDIGGTGMKAGIVDTSCGEMVTERFRIPTPQPATPQGMAPVVTELVTHFDYTGPIGVAFPAIIKKGVVCSASNIDPGWVTTDAATLFGSVAGQAMTLINDADAAGLAEVGFGAAVGVNGVVLVLTFGTGIGSGLFIDGKLVANVEVGHLHFEGHAPVEVWAASKARQRENLTWAEWAERVDRLLAHLSLIFSPTLIVFGGGASKNWHEFSSFIGGNTPVVPAVHRNNAGIIGAALFASRGQPI